MYDLLVKQKEPPQPPEWQTQLQKMFGQLGSRIDEMEQKFTSNKQSEKPVTKGEMTARIRSGMRAVTVETPSESAGVAGLLEPEDRVDIVFSLGGKGSVLFDPLKLFANPSEIPAETLIENARVLAVDRQVDEIEGNDQKKKSDSVTLSLTSEMARDIAKAAQVGTLTLVLRGQADSQEIDPQFVLRFDQFIAKYQIDDSPEILNDIPVNSSQSIQVVELRGVATTHSSYSMSKRESVVPDTAGQERNFNPGSSNSGSGAR